MVLEVESTRAPRGRSHVAKRIRGLQKRRPDPCQEPDSPSAHQPSASLKETALDSARPTMERGITRLLQVAAAQAQHAADELAEVAAKAARAIRNAVRRQKD